MKDLIHDRLAELWQLGVFRCEADTLYSLVREFATHPRVSELVVFAQLAALLEGQTSERQTVETPLYLQSDDLCVQALHTATFAWLAATTLRPQEAVAALQRMNELLQLATTTQPNNTHLPATIAWSNLVIAEIAVALNDLETARFRLHGLIGDQTIPVSVYLNANIRLAMLDGIEETNLAVQRLDEMASLAQLQGKHYDVVHAVLYAGLFSLIKGDAEEAQLRFKRVVSESVEVPQRYAVLSQIFLAIIASQIKREDALAHIGVGIRMAAETGDYLAYLILIILAARLYLKSGSAADAIATLSNGIFHLRRACGSIAAIPLLAEREALRQTLGEVDYEIALTAAIDQLEHDYTELQGSMK